MKNSILRAIPFILAIFFILFNNSCNSSNPQGPDYKGNSPTSPATLADNIPYSVLGSGKIAFERIGPENNAYSGGYIIDVDAKKSNLFLNGILDLPSISPNGNLIAFLALTTKSNTYYDIHVINKDGTNLTRVSEFEGNVEAFPSWKPDGSIIYRVLNMVAGSDIYLQRPGSKLPSKIFNVSSSIGGSINSPISCLNKGSYLFSTYLDTAIYIYENGMINTVKLKFNSTSGRRPQVISPKWSPNETEIACMVTETDSPFTDYKVSIIKMNPDGSNLKILTAYETTNHIFWSGGNDFSLCWSPDGTKILFNKLGSGLKSHIYVMNADGSQITQVTTLAGVCDRSVSWSN